MGRIPIIIPLDTDRLGENEVLDRHPRKGRQGLDLSMLFGINFNRESIHTVKIVNFDNLVKLKAQKLGSCDLFRQSGATDMHRGETPIR